MDNISNTAWRIITPLFAVAVAILVLGGIATQPWHVMPELGADGGKNIFTYLYHSIYETGLHFQGMNYPYGEHIVYTDGQPILSVPLSYFKGYITIPVAMAIMWYTTTLGFILGIIFTERILGHYKVARPLSLVFAGLIMACSPQVLRVSGHYALAFSAVIPMLFWFTLQYHETRRLKYPLFIFLVGCFAAFMHPYFSAVTLIWCAFYAVSNVVAGSGTFKARIFNAIMPLLAAAMVLAVFGTVMKLTDDIADRPAVPYGVLDHVTHIKDIFSSGYSPFWAFVKEHSRFSKISYGGEGYTYPGIVVLFAVGIACVLSIRRAVAREATLRDNSFSRVWLLMAVMGLLLGCGAPFTWGMAWLLDYASALRQFRTLGRFSWLAYYIVTVYGAVLISHWYTAMRASGRRNPAVAMLTLTFFIWGVEAGGYVDRTHKVVVHGYTNYKTFKSIGEQSWPQFLGDRGYKSGNFQAIIVLPFFATGSEKLWVSSNQDITDWSIAMGVKAGMQLQLPMMDIMMSRSSWEQTFAQVKTAGGPYTHKTALANVISSRPMLLLHTDNAPLNPDQQFLINQSQYIGHFLHCSVYRCDPARILAVSDSMRIAAVTISAHMAVTDTCIGCNDATWFVDHMDASNYNFAVFGLGARSAESQQTDVLCNIPVTPATNGQLYEFSCWFHVPRNDYRSPKCMLELLDDKGNTITTASASTIESTDNFTMTSRKYISKPYTHGYWLRCNAYFNMPIGAKTVRCRILNFAEQPFEAVDELMIRPAGALIISKGMANNHLLVKEKYR